MPRLPTVVHIGVFGPLPGGMAQVLNEYLSWRFVGLAVRAMASTTGRGDPWAPLRSARCMLALLAVRLSCRPHAVVLHLSSGGSFVREGGLLAWTRLLRLPAAVHLHGSEFAERWPRLVGVVLRLARRVYVLTDETRAIARAAVSAPDRAARLGAAAGKRIAERYSEAAVVTRLERESTELLDAPA
jgi:hypothetical protein